MNKKRGNGIYIIIAVLLVVAIGLSIAYAALSTTLNINFTTVTQTTQTWDVKFNPTGSVTATSSGTDGTGNVTGMRVCGTATVDATTISIAATTLSKPQDKCIWKFTVKNSGTIDAKLQGLSATAPTSTYANDNCTVATAKNTITCANIKYTLATDTSGTLLTTGGTLAKSGGTKDIYVIAEYLDVSSISDTVNIKAATSSATEVTHTNAKFTVAYYQK